MQRGSKRRLPVSVWRQLRWKQESIQPWQDVTRPNHVEHPGTSIRQTHTHLWFHTSSIIVCLHAVCLSVCNRMISPEFSPPTQAPTAVAVWTPPPAWANEIQASLWLRLSLLTTGRQHLHPLHQTPCNSDFSQDPYGGVVDMDHSMQLCGPRVKCIDVFGLILPKFSQPLDLLLLYRLLTCLGGAAMKKKMPLVLVENISDSEMGYQKGLLG